MPLLTDRIARRAARIMVQAVQALRVLFYRLASTGMRVTGRARRVQPVYCLGRGRIDFGQNTQFGYAPAPGFLTGYCHLNPRGESAAIVFGRDVIVNNGVTMIAEAATITIGDRVLIGPEVSIYDSDFHGLAVADRQNPQAVRRGDVTIGNDVFIGARAIILKNLRIGDGAVIAAGAVVTRDVPPNSVAAGNPARVVRSL